jgi:hypothetical protein
VILTSAATAATTTTSSSSSSRNTATTVIIIILSHSPQDIDDVKFSPDCTLLAAASHDNFIDVYEVR